MQQPRQNEQLRSLSLFSGIGGLDLGLNWATGAEPVRFCESNEYCREVLAQHWPGVPCTHDVRELHGQEVGPVHIVQGGFPCVDVSKAGRRAGIDGERSGLWSEFARIIREIRPLPIVFVENVRALTIRGLDRVLGDLADLGFDAEWDCIGACCVGAPHRRERLFILGRPPGPVPDTVRNLLRQQRERNRWQHSHPGTPVAGDDGEEGRVAGRLAAHAVCANPALPGLEGSGFPGAVADRDRRDGSHWLSEPAVGRVVARAPPGVGRRARDAYTDAIRERLQALGNTVVPMQAARAWEILAPRLDLT